MVDAIYIHTPFCLKKCEYCDFLSIGYKEEKLNTYFSYLKKEILMHDSYNYDSVYFGGGTASLLFPEMVKELLSMIDYSSDAEITLEVNPATVDYDKLKAFKDAGINRLSIGIQSFNNNHLKTLGRVHNSDEALSCYNLAREVGFENISIDLIFATPNQTLDDLKKDLKIISNIKPEHISIYSLIWEEGTPFFEKLKKGILRETDEELEISMYELIIAFLKNLGYTHYEVSNFAFKGLEARHNKKYWENKDYVGIGLGASTFIDGCRMKNFSDFDDYYKKIDQNLLPMEINDFVGEEDRIFIGLRLLIDGVSIKDKKNKEIAEKLVNKGFLENYKNDYYRLTHKGLLLGNDVFMEFV